MNLIAIDIGNTNIDIGLFLKDKEKFIESVAGSDTEKVQQILKDAWEQIPVSERSREGLRDGVIVVSSVRPDWTKMVRKFFKDEYNEKILVLGDNIPLSLTIFVDEPLKVGTDRVAAALAAYAVVEDAVVIADCGTALTIDLVDENGAFQGGVICPGLAMEAKSLSDGTAQLPEIQITRPELPYGKNTTEAINCGLYYAAIGTMEEVIRRYAEKIGKWPQTILTGGGAKVIKDDCQFIDNYVPNLVVKGIALAYRDYLSAKSGKTT